MARGENCLIAVAGQPTAVTNGTIAGIIDEAGKGLTIAETFGASSGLAGLLDGKIADMGAQKRKVIENLRRTPGSVLPGRHRIMSDEDGTRLIAALREREIGTLFLIGGVPAVNLLRFVQGAAEKAGYDLLCLGVPLSSENEVGAGDHNSGYGSGARFAASLARDAGVLAQGGEEPIVVLELLGAQNGWLAAASALSRDAEHPAPHAVLLPEHALNSETLVEDLRRAYQKFGYVVAVTTEGAKDTDGNSLDGTHLTALLSEKLGLGVRCVRPGGLLRVSQNHIARADADDAYNLGQLAVRLSGDECSGYLVLVNRDPHGSDRDRGYKTVEGSARLDQVEEAARPLPPEYLSGDSHGVNDAFLDWARPLIGGALTEYVALESV